MVSWAALACLVLAATAGAQDLPGASAVPASGPEGGAAAEAVDAVEEARERLRGAHVGELAGRTRVATHAARPLLRASGDIVDIERTLPNLEAEIRRLVAPARIERVPSLPQRELTDLRATFRRHARLLDGWQGSLTEHIGELETARSAVVELRRTWSELRELSERAGGTGERHERIRAAHETTRTVASELDVERDRCAELSDRIADLQTSVQDMMELLRDAAGAYRERLGVADAPPLWSGLSRGEGSLAEDARASFLARTDAPSALLSDLGPMLGVLGLLAVLVLGGLVLLARRVAAVGGKRPMGPFALEVLERPVAATSLLVLLSATVLLEHAPIVVYDALFFAALIPLLRAVPPLAQPALRPLVRGAVGFVFVDRLQSILAEGSALLRLVLLAEGLLAFVAAAAWLRSTRSSERDRLLASVRLAVGAGALVIAAALLANLAGYLFLATALTRGVGYGTYAALGLSGGVIVLEAVVDLVIASPLGDSIRSLAEHGELVRVRSYQALSAAAALLFLGLLLDGFGLSGPFYGWAEEVLGAPHRIGTLELSLGEVFGAILVLVVTYVVLRLVRFHLELDVLPRLSLEPGVDGAISGLTRYAIGGSGLLLSLAWLGIDAEQIALVAGALGVGIGFGLQGIVANFIAGIVLMLERPVRLGDFVEVGPLVGRVERIGLRSSTVKALDGAEVIVPNESLISREVINWTLSDRKRRVEVKVGVAYGSDPRQVHRILEKVAMEHEGVVQFESSRTLFDGFGESSLDFSLQFWAGSYEDGVRLKSEVALAVHDALKDANIEIPFPQRDIRILSMPKPGP